MTLYTRRLWMRCSFALWGSLALVSRGICMFYLATCQGPSATRRVACLLRNSSGLLITFGGSQEVFAAGLAAAGCQPRSKHDASRRRRRGSRHLRSYLASQTKTYEYCCVLLWAWAAQTFY